MAIFSRIVNIACLKSTSKLINLNNISSVFTNSKPNGSILSQTKNLFSTNPIRYQQIKRVDPKRFQPKSDLNTKNLVWYTMSGLVIMGGMSYAAVPLFKIFCESQGMDVNTDFKDMNIEFLVDRLRAMKKVEDRDLVVKFVACTSADLKWDFVPQQTEITIAPGETALAFFKAKNNTKRPIVGIATYTIVPYEAGLYFNKIQCFCFEEQRLEPGEEVDMPVFFYIDDQYCEDAKLQDKDEICLSYTFFESKGSEDFEALQQAHQQVHAAN